MVTVRVKICGITRKEDVDAAVAAGADAVGFVVGTASSPRNISLEKAEGLIKQVPAFVKTVLVTVPRSIDDLEVFEKLNPDLIQIHGEYISDSSIREALPKTRVVRALKADAFNAVEAACKASEAFSAVLLDSSSRGMYGGTGIVHDWKLSMRVKQAIHPKPLILAGGLNPENVAEAVRSVQPYAVDVSSGVEQRAGIKNRQKMVDFVKNAKEFET